MLRRELSCSLRSIFHNKEFLGINYTKANAGDIMSGIGGSETFNTLRSILTVKYCDSDESVRTIEASKMSFRGKEKTPVGIRQLDDDTLEFFDYKKWLQGDVSVSRSDEAVSFLQELLADGPVDSNVVKSRAAEKGISMSTINIVKKEAGVMSRQQADRSSLWMFRQ